MTVFLWNRWAVCGAFEWNLSCYGLAGLAGRIAYFFVYQSAGRLGLVDTLQDSFHGRTGLHSAFVGVGIGHLDTFLGPDQATSFQVFQPANSGADFALEVLAHPPNSSLQFSYTCGYIADEDLFPSTLDINSFFHQVGDRRCNISFGIPRLFRMK